jgi:hypothetical protein
MTEAVKELVAAAEECASRRYEPRLSKAVEAVQNDGSICYTDAIDLACQRNLLLERFKELHNAGGQVWIEDLIHRIEPEWKSYWTLLAEEDARECALANEDGCPTGEHARTEEK